MTPSPGPQEAMRKLKTLVEDIHVASFVTVDGDGALRGRPMATLEIGDDPELWFFTNDDTSKVDSLLVHPQVCVCYADPQKNRYVSISGSAELVRDRERIRALWKPQYKAWFPEGVDDPDLGLIRVDVVGAQYWDAASSALVQLFGMLKAIVTGESAGSTIAGENEKVTVRTRIGPDTVS